MKRFLTGRWMTLAVAVMCVTMLCGCQLQNNTSSTFLDFVNTILLGITAAGAVAILRNI